jgi:hypothetical protein
MNEVNSNKFIPESNRISFILIPEKYPPQFSVVLNTATLCFLLSSRALTILATLFPTITKSITIKGSNAGIAGSDYSRLEETVFKDIVSTNITGNNVSIDGLKFLQTGNTLDLLIVQSLGVVIQNCIFERNAITTGQIARAIVSSSNAENYVIKNNLFTGSIEGGLFSGHKSWNSGLFLTNGGKAGTIEGNTLKNLRTAINFDENNSLVNLKNNIFLNFGTYLSFVGITTRTQGEITSDNIFDI